MRIFSISTGFVFLSIHFARAVVYQSIDNLQKTDFDFIIAGGGTAGPVVASRLSENPKHSVLLIEAGPDSKDELTITVPGLNGQIPSTYNWNYSTIAQPGLNNRTVAYTRGYTLGGSSCLNGMVYTRGSASDYDRWARITGDNRWSWKNLLPLIKRHEKWSPPADGRDVTGKFTPTAHGHGGNVRVSLPGTGETAFDRLVLENAKGNKEFPFDNDINDGTNLGVAYTQSTIGGGERSSAAAAYLGPEQRARRNLHIVLNTRATRVLASKHRPTDFRILEVAANATASRRTITATKEIILSAGAINSPQILLNSGIGPAEELRALGINTTLNIHDVGKNLQDHPVTSAIWLTNGTAVPPPDPTLSLEQWQQNRTGPLTDPIGHFIAWTRVPKDSIAWDVSNDQSSGPGAPHIELAVGGFGQIASAAAVLLTPQSRGSIKLHSADPFDPPLIDLGFLSNRWDVLALREGIRAAFRWYAGKGFTDYVTTPLSDNPDTTPVESIENQIRQGAATTLHAVGTAAMSARNAKTGVVDPDLKVKGATGLRVIDASVMPYIITGHTVAGVYALAERGAEFIREAWD